MERPTDIRVSFDVTPSWWERPGGAKDDVSRGARTVLALTKAAAVTEAHMERTKLVVQCFLPDDAHFVTLHDMLEKLRAIAEAVS